MKCIILANNCTGESDFFKRELYAEIFLNSENGKALIQNVFETASLLTSEKNILTVTNLILFEKIKHQIEKLCKKPLIISEPLSKNTAPAIASALTYLQSKKDETVLILPLDFAVEDVSLFKAEIKKASEFVKKDHVVCFGVKPSSKEFGVNYIQTDENIGCGKKIQRFITTNETKNTEKFADQKGFYLNTGVYTAKSSVLADLYLHHKYNHFSKEMFDIYKNIKYEFYENIPGFSIENILAEKIENTVFVELTSKIKYLGCIQALCRKNKKDSKNNSVTKNVILDNVKDTLVYSPKEITAVSGIKNTAVIETKDVLLVCDKSKISDLPELFKKLNDEKLNVSYKTVIRPWGFYSSIKTDKSCFSKIITVSSGCKLSLAPNNYVFEHLFILDGTASIVLDKKEYVLKKGQSINIAKKTKCIIYNKLKEPLKILEVQKRN